MTASANAALDIGLAGPDVEPSPAGVGLPESMEAEIAHVNRWRRRNAYYYAQLHRLFRLHIPPGASVLEILEPRSR